MATLDLDSPAGPAGTGDVSARIRWGVAVCRFLTVLSLIVWLGGLAFLGPVAAPAIFKINRVLGPQMVGAMLGRFTPLIYVAAILLLAGWIAEGQLTRPQGLARRLWWLQGGGSIVMLLLAVYLGIIVMPRIVALQPQIVAGLNVSNTPPAASMTAPSALASHVNPVVKAEFDAAHKTYTTLTSVTVWIGLAVAFIFCLRTALVPNGSER
jgi:uncharacterized membrane protein